VYYPDGSGATDLTTASSGNPAVEAFFYNQSTGTDGGVQIYGASKNWALHSEDVSNAAWVATNATKSTSSMTRPDGTTANTDVLTATAANGEVVQDTGDTAASDKWMFSIFVKCPSGTVAGKSIYGNHNMAKSVFRLQNIYWFCNRKCKRRRIDRYEYGGAAFVGFNGREGQ
jgi:hypothetical protein